MLPVWRCLAYGQQPTMILAQRTALHGMSDFSEALSRLMTDRGTGVRELARAVFCNPGHVSNLRSGKSRPSPELAALIDDYLGAGGQLAALVPSAATAAVPPLPGGDEI